MEGPDLLGVLTAYAWVSETRMAAGHLSVPTLGRESISSYLVGEISQHIQKDVKK